MQDLTWTDEPPTEEGYYWMRDPRFEKTEVIHEIYRHVTEDHLMVGQMNSEKVQDLDAHWQWAGPIPEPSESGADLWVVVHHIIGDRGGTEGVESVVGPMPEAEAREIAVPSRYIVAKPLESVSDE